MSETAANQCPVGGLWVPGMHLDAEYTVPGNTELKELWAEYTAGSEPVQTTQDVLGVYMPPKDVTAVASIDLCEVTRGTLVSLDTATGIKTGFRSSYSQGTWFESTKYGSDYERSVVVSTVRAVIDEGLVQPVDNIEKINKILRTWRTLGVYCVANTSTLPGCERGTIRHTLQRDMPGCFDALVLPRNHDGKGPMIKARALGVLCTEAGIDIANLPLIHIDDAEHHLDGFTALYKDNVKLKIFKPVYVPRAVDTPVHHYETPLAAFEAANDHFREQGVI